LKLPINVFAAIRFFLAISQDINKPIENLLRLNNSSWLFIYSMVKRFSAPIFNRGFISTVINSSGNQRGLIDAEVHSAKHIIPYAFLEPGVS